MLYPTYQINNVPMQDLNGRWHEHPENRPLPALPGLRAASLLAPGVGGERTVPQTPIEAQDFVLRMVVNAVEANGRRPTTIAGRLRALHTNTRELIKAMGVSGMTQGGYATIQLYLSADEIRVTSGRLETATEIEYDTENDYVEIDFIFRLPYGIWRGSNFFEQAISASRSTLQYLTLLKNSTAPIDGPWVTLVGPFNSLTVTNQYGNGFTYNKPVPVNQAVVVNTEYWTATEPFSVDQGLLGRSSYPPMYPSAALVQVGRASGVALTLLPEPEGVPLRVTGTGRGGDTAVFVHTTEAFF